MTNLSQTTFTCKVCGDDGVERIGEGPFNKTRYPCPACSPTETSRAQTTFTCWCGLKTHNLTRKR